MLQELPVELLNQIVSHLSAAQSVARLSICNHALQKYTDNEGWKTFVQTNFPDHAIKNKNHWTSAARTLTTLSRNLDRKAFIARYVEPSRFITKLPSRDSLSAWQKPRGQTMGYQPVIDSYEESTGAAWDSRRQVLAWSAGAELVIRVKGLGDIFKADSRGTQSYLDHYGHQTRWFTYRPVKAHEGRDDITSLRLLKGRYKAESGSSTDVEHIILGTASGKLTLSHLELDRASANTLGGVFETQQQLVRCVDVEASKETILAACLGSSTVALYHIPQFLYSVPDRHESIRPFCAKDVSPEGNSKYLIRSTQFLSPTTLAVGAGPSLDPIRIYQVTNAGLSHEPVRKFSNFDDGEMQTPAYSIKVLPSKQDTGDNFLSGGYDGIVRLHDLRSPEPFVSIFTDLTDDGAIYSLETIGIDRFVAGGSRHSLLKFFDLRFSRHRSYHQTRLSRKLGHTSAIQSGWNLFLNPQGNPRISAPHNSGRSSGQPNPATTNWRRTRATTSPVYSLSSPSITSPTLFAGVENHIVELDFLAMLDAHPDPVFSRAIVRDRAGNLNVSQTWNPRHDVLNFGGYEHAIGEAETVRLRTQAGIGKYAGAMEGWDERWRDGG